MIEARMQCGKLIGLVAPVVLGVAGVEEISSAAEERILEVSRISVRLTVVWLVDEVKSSHV